MQPINYSIDVQSPFDQALKGFQTGLGIQDLQAKREAERQAQDAQRQMQSDLMAASKDMTQIPGLMVRYPQLAEKLKHGWDAMNADQQKNLLSTGSEVLSALHTGRSDIAIAKLKEQATARRNAGDEAGAKTADDMAAWAERDPDSLKTATALRLSALPGGEKMVSAITALGKESREAAEAPAKLRTAEAQAAGAEAEAATKGVQAKFAEPLAVAELQAKGWNVKAIQADIEYKREQSRINAMRAALDREGNELKQQELALKIKEAESKLDQGIRDKTAAADTGASQIDNMLNTIERVKQSKALPNVLGTIEGRMPAIVSDENADAIALIETLGSQAFLAQVPTLKGLGALSNAEGEKLQSALQSMSRTQSEKQFRANLEEAARLLKKGRAALERSTGVPLFKPDTPAAPGGKSYMKYAQ